MNRNPSILLIIWIMAILSCNRDHLPDPLPDMTIAVSPVTGQTTQVFQIEAKAIDDEEDNRFLYFR